MISKFYEVDIQKLERLLIAKGWAASEIANRGAFSKRRVDQIIKGG